jgi:hypothetical protein
LDSFFLPTSPNGDSRQFQGDLGFLPPLLGDF